MSLTACSAVVLSQPSGPMLWSGLSLASIGRMSGCDANADSGLKDKVGSNVASRMEQYERREREFLEFVAETQNIDSVNEDPDQPLSGLQCLLALTEILDRAVLLRKINFSLEQRIEELDQVKLLAEVFRTACCYVSAVHLFSIAFQDVDNQCQCFYHSH